MKEELQELYKYRELLYMIAYRDVKVRYKQSIMGFMWAILMPIVIVVAGVVVRYAYAFASHVPLRTTDIASVAVKSLPWAFLVSSVRFGCNSLIGANNNLVTKIYFPREIFPLAAVIASLFDFFVASGALLIFLLMVKVGWSYYLIWVPLLLLNMVILASGIAMIVSAASLFFRDVKYIVEVAADVRYFLHAGVLRRKDVRGRIQMVDAQPRGAHSRRAECLHRSPPDSRPALAGIQRHVWHRGVSRWLYLLQASRTGLRGEHLTGEFHV